VPVTVKCRLGVDDQDPEAALDAIADAAVGAGADALIVHARKAWLKGLSPKENREIPPLDYDRVYRLKRRLPDVPVAVNGGIADLAQAAGHLVHLDGVMLGRAAYQNPELLMEVDPALFGRAAPVDDARAAVEALVSYAATHIAAGGRLWDVARHMLGLFAGRPGARAWRRTLATEAIKPDVDPELLLRASEVVGPPRDAAEAA
jgi:tRNA-dihydrouridine synthase A